MSDSKQKPSPATQPVVFPLSGTEDVPINPGLVYRRASGGALTMDVYLPSASDPTPLPVVVVVAGFPDAGYERIMGCRFKDTGFATSWSRLIAASGLAAIAYANEAPEADARAALAFIRERGEALGIDGSRVALFACSGNVPLALSLALRDESDSVRCAVLYYGYMPDDSGSTRLAEAAAQWRFVNPFEEKPLDSVRPDVSLFIARAGGDAMPHLNATIDRFVALATERNLPITLVNHPDGPHAFDLFHDSDATRSVIRQTLAFLKAQWE